MPPLPIEDIVLAVFEKTLHLPRFKMVIEVEQDLSRLKITIEAPNPTKDDEVAQATESESTSREAEVKEDVKEADAGGEMKEMISAEAPKDHEAPKTKDADMGEAATDIEMTNTAIKVTGVEDPKETYVGDDTKDVAHTDTTEEDEDLEDYCRWQGWSY